MKIANVFRMMNGHFEKQDNKFEAFHEAMKNSNKRLEGLQLQVQRPPIAAVGIREGKSGELKGIATKAGGRRITPPKPQRQQPLLPSELPRLLPQSPMMYQ